MIKNCYLHTFQDRLYTYLDWLYRFESIFGILKFPAGLYILYIRKDDVGTHRYNSPKFY